MKVLVGSENPVKIKAVEDAFSNYFKATVQGKSVKSNVPNQPFGKETFDGAKNRAMNLMKMDKADYYVGIEAGIEERYQKWYVFSVVCIINSQGQESYSTTINWQIPDILLKQILKGDSMGKAMDSLSGEKNTKQKEGGIGYYTNNVLNRTKINKDAVIGALVRFL